MSIRFVEDLEHQTSLRRPALATRAELLANLGVGK
jgi:hypothetical protein